MSKIVFQVGLHPDDAAAIRRVADACGIEPPVFIALAAYRYARSVRRGDELPPNHSTRRAWCSVCGHSYVPGED